MELRAQTPESIQLKPFLSQMRKLSFRQFKSINYDNTASQVEDKARSARVTFPFLNNLQ